METMKVALEFYLVMAALFLTLIIFILLLLLGVKLPLKIKNPYIRILILATILSVLLAPHIFFMWAPPVWLLCGGAGGGRSGPPFIYGLFVVLATWIFLIISIYLLWGKKWIREKNAPGK